MKFRIYHLAFLLLHTSFYVAFAQITRVGDTKVDPKSEAFTDSPVAVFFQDLSRGGSKIPFNVFATNRPQNSFNFSGGKKSQTLPLRNPEQLPLRNPEQQDSSKPKFTILPAVKQDFFSDLGQKILAALGESGVSSPSVSEIPPVDENENFVEQNKPRSLSSSGSSDLKRESVPSNIKIRVPSFQQNSFPTFDQTDVPLSLKEDFLSTFDGNVLPPSDQDIFPFVGENGKTISNQELELNRNINILQDSSVRIKDSRLPLEASSTPLEVSPPLGGQTTIPTLITGSVSTNNLFTKFKENGSTFPSQINFSNGNSFSKFNHGPEPPHSRNLPGESTNTNIVSEFKPNNSAVQSSAAAPSSTFNLKQNAINNAISHKFDQNTVPVLKSGNVPVLQQGNLPILNQNNLPISANNLPVFPKSNFLGQKPGNLPFFQQSTFPSILQRNLPVPNRSNLPVIQQSIIPASNQGNQLVFQQNNLARSELGNLPLFSQGNFPGLQQGNLPVHKQDSLTGFQQNNFPSLQQGNLPVFPKNSQVFSTDNLPPFLKEKLPGLKPGSIVVLTQNTTPFPIATNFQTVSQNNVRELKQISSQDISKAFALPGNNPTIPEFNQSVPTLLSKPFFPQEDLSSARQNNFPVTDHNVAQRLNKSVFGFPDQQKGPTVQQSVPRPTFNQNPLQFTRNNFLIQKAQATSPIPQPDEIIPALNATPESDLSSDLPPINFEELSRKPDFNQVIGKKREIDFRSNDLNIESQNEKITEKGIIDGGFRPSNFGRSLGQEDIILAPEGRSLNDDVFAAEPSTGFVPGILERGFVPSTFFNLRVKRNY